MPESSEALWRAMRERVRRLQALLPPEIDLADCDDLTRSHLRDLSERLEFLIESYHLDAREGEIPYSVDKQARRMIRDSIQHLGQFAEPPQVDGDRDESTDDESTSEPETDPVSSRIDWSKPNSPTQWADKFGVSYNKMVELLNGDTLRVKEVSPRLFMIALDDIPADAE